jgi:hypothetical protein
MLFVKQERVIFHQWALEGGCGGGGGGGLDQTSTRRCCVNDVAKQHGHFTIMTASRLLNKESTTQIAKDKQKTDTRKRRREKDNRECSVTPPPRMQIMLGFETGQTRGGNASRIEELKGSR